MNGTATATDHAKVRCPQCGRTLAAVDADGIAVRYRDRVRVQVAKAHVECTDCGIMVSLLTTQEVGA